MTGGGETSGGGGEKLDWNGDVDEERFLKLQSLEGSKRECTTQYVFFSVTVVFLMNMFID